MHRTQLYLEADDVELLDRAAARTGASRSELVRRAIRSHYGEQTAQTRLAALRASAGTWGDRSATGGDVVANTRGDLNERLDHLGLR